MIRRFALAMLIALPMLASPAAAQDRLVRRFSREFGRATQGHAPEEYPNRGLSEAGVRRLWSVMDSIVLARLRAGDDLAHVDSLLRTLPGYEGPSVGDGERIGRTMFYRTLPHDAPSYMVAAVDSPGTVVLGVYGLNMATAGRVSAFARRGGRWQRTGVFQAADPVHAFTLPTGAGRWGLATVEVFTGADRQDCHLKLWTLTAAGLRRDTAYAQRMIDCQVEQSGGEIRIVYDSFPSMLSTGVLGVRLAYLRVLRADRGRLRANDQPVNPWVHVVEQYYALLHAGRRGDAAALLASPGLARQMPPHIGAADDEGDPSAGTGSLTGRTIRGDEETWRRIRSARGSDGRWRIVAVEPASDPFPAQ
jgi:hypothetical protein